MLLALGIREAAKRLRQLTLRKAMHRGGLLSDAAIVLHRFLPQLPLVALAGHDLPHGTMRLAM
jgi:hypothetical protein